MRRTTIINSIMRATRLLAGFVHGTDMRLVATMRCTTGVLIRNGIFTAALLLQYSAVSPVAAKNQETDFWQTKENLTLRLSAEWHKITVLQRESDAIADVLTTLRDLELYPAELTQFTDKSLITFDKDVERLEKRNETLRKQIDALKTPLSDAIAILRQMVIDEPVESMFKTLERGNLNRITDMLGIKHNFDSLWMHTDTLLDRTLTSMGVRLQKKRNSGPMEDEFFAILKANLGLQSETYYQRLTMLKNTFKAKSDPTQKAVMLNIERQRILGYLKSGDLQLADRKIDEVLKRFADDIDASEFLMYKIRITFQQRDYEKVLSLLEKVPDNDTARRMKFIYRMQSLYSLREYHQIIRDTANPVLKTLTDRDQNLMLWIISESAFQLGLTQQVLHFAQQVEKNKPYALHIFHTLARSYYRLGDDTTALSILKKALNNKTTTDDDRVARHEISMTIAQLYYERGEYEKALELFYSMLNNEKLFERSLFGIVWCYLQSNQYGKAETALRKLINQAPDKSWGAEGILILARRYLQNATFAWKKHTYIIKEKQRLTGLLARLDTLKNKTSSPEKTEQLTHAMKEIEKLLEKLKAERLADFTTISSYYDNIEELCTFINSHYYTGTFQEISFSRKRERILHTIDSVLVELKQGSAFHANDTLLSNARKERRKIKSIVDDATLFSTISLINRYRWEREYIDWKKTQRSVISGDDSATTAPVDSQPHLTAIDSLLVVEDSLRQHYFSVLKKRIRDLLEAPLDSSDACYLLYQLGELYYHNENSNYAEMYTAYDKQSEQYTKDLERFRNGKLTSRPKEPVLPQLHHDTSIMYFRKAIAVQPTSLFGGAAHYSLAWCYNDLAEFDSSYHHMRTVATKFSDHPYAAQAWMFCGEYHFDKGNLDEALKCFYTVMQYPESEWFDEALYKVAWTQYRLSNPQKAISSFLALVDLGGGKFGQSLLAKESMDYIAISFSETDISGEKGLQRAASFVKRLGDADRGCQILYRLGQVYREQGRHAMAKKTFQLLLSTYPSYSQNPRVEADLLAVLEKDATTSDLSLRKKYEYFKKYNRNSKWAMQQPDSSRTFADSIAAKMLYDASISYHQQALQFNDREYYDKAIETYSAYISHYPKSPLANECHYNLAEIQFSLGNYQQAAEEYMAVSRRYPDSKYRETAAWNAIVASQNLLKLETQHDGGTR